MTMNKLTDSEIVLALHNLYVAAHHKETVTMSKETAIGLYEYFNHQKAEIEELIAIFDILKERTYYKKFVKEIYQKEKGNDLVYPDADYIYQRFFEQATEIESLNVDLNKRVEEIKELKKKNAKLANDTIRAYIACDGAKAEAVKEFAERLKVICKDFADYFDDHSSVMEVFAEKIDSLVKEMVGEDNA